MRGGWRGVLTGVVIVVLDDDTANYLQTKTGGDKQNACASTDLSLTGNGQKTGEYEGFSGNRRLEGVLTGVVVIVLNDDGADYLKTKC